MRDMVVFWKPRNMVYFESAEEEECGRFQIRKNEDTVYIVSVLFFRIFPVIYGSIQES